ncbi:MAG: hypothetical protein HY835_15175 [Anaerolineae bacterium]|nr:hypothetical protein [Anaerolineae bacterium]
MGNCSQYEIVIEGYIDDTWKSWFEGLDLHYIQNKEDNSVLTVLSIAVKDPALLQGVLSQIAASNLPLVRVERVSRQQVV